MTPARKTTVRRVPDGHFRQWHVTYACGCPERSFRTFPVALTFATHHACPPPWAPIPKRSKRLTPAVR